MNTIIEYCVVTSIDTGELSAYVNLMLESGWQPYGSIATSSEGMLTRYLQSMVKYKTESHRKN